MSAKIFAALRAPFRWSELEHRQQGKPSAKGNLQILTYVQRKAIIDRLDEVVGPDCWQDAYEVWTGGDSAKCMLSLFIGDRWVCKQDAADQTDIEAVKGGITNAFKRAASKWGIGLYLYDFPAVWIQGKAVGDKVYPPNDVDQQILERVRRDQPHLLHPDDRGTARTKAAPPPQDEPPPSAPPAQQNVLVRAEEPAWLDDELGQGRFVGALWRWFTEPSEDGGRIGYLVHLIETDPTSQWGQRAAVVYLFRCTKTWFSIKLRDGKTIDSVDVIGQCKAKGLTP